MPLHPVYGHDDLRSRLAGTLAAGKLPTALLLVGPPGIGKQRLGLWIAAGVLCEAGPGAPCGHCQSCRLVDSLQHPDAHWLFPLARPKGDESKQVEEAEELLGEALVARRKEPLYPRPDGMAGLFLPTVRLLHRRAMMRPVMSRAKVFLVGEADRLVPQAANPEAANAMLKILEEPPPDTHFILTTAEPSALLPTIRSRLVPLRLRRLPSEAVTRFLQEVPSPPLSKADAEHRAEAAFGSIGDALEERSESDEAASAAGRLLAAARGGAVERFKYALGAKPVGARGDLSETLDGAAEILRDELAQRLRGAGGSGYDDVPAERLLEAIRVLEKARGWARGNVNPLFIVAEVGRRLEALGL